MMMTVENVMYLNQAQTAVYQLELLQEMAKKQDDKQYPISEYAYLLDNIVKQLKDNLEAIKTT